MAELAPIAAIAAIAGTGAQAYSAIKQGQGINAADKYAANIDKTKAEYAGAAAEETNASMTDKLATTLGNIDVIRAANHTDPTSPTTQALRDRASEVSNQERAIRVGNIYAQQTQDLTDAAYQQSAGDFALNMGYVNAGIDVAKAIGQTNPNLFGFTGTPGGPTPNYPLSGPVTPAFLEEQP